MSPEELNETVDRVMQQAQQLWRQARSPTAAQLQDFVKLAAKLFDVRVWSNNEEQTMHARIELNPTVFDYLQNKYSPGEDSKISKEEEFFLKYILKGQLFGGQSITVVSENLEHALNFNFDLINHGSRLAQMFQEQLIEDWDKDIAFHQARLVNPFNSESFDYAEDIAGEDEKSPIKEENKENLDARAVEKEIIDRLIDYKKNLRAQSGKFMSCSITDETTAIAKLIKLLVGEPVAMDNKDKQIIGENKFVKGLLALHPETKFAQVLLSTQNKPPLLRSKSEGVRPVREKNNNNNN